MAETILETPILVAAERCIELFEVFLDAARALDATVASPYDDPSVQLLENQYGRFNSWTENIGVFADGNASLDARLQGNSWVSKLILDQLWILENHLDSFRKSYLEDENGSLEDQDGQMRDEAEGTASGTSGSDDGSDSDSSPDTLADEPEDIRRTKGAIDRLIRLSQAIRRSSIAEQNERAANYTELDEDGVEKVSMFADMALKLVQTWYPDASLNVQIRLADTMKIRRRQLLYRTKHVRKLKGTARRTSGPKRQYLAPQTVNTAVHRTTSVRQPSPRSVLSLRSAALSKTHSVSKLSETQASAFVPAKFDPDITSTIASTAVSAAPSTVEVFDWPNPPKAAPGATEVVCPHCTVNVAKMEANDEKWKQHLLRDLEPWVCLFEQCSEPHKLFRDRHSWATHMKTHAVQWQCALPGHPSQRFTAEEDYDSHMKSSHPGFSAAELSGLKQWSLKPSAVPFRSCPICLENFVTDGADSHLGNTFQLQRRLQSHITRHLLRMAFYCIPFRDDDDASVSSDPEETNRRVAESTVNKVPSVAYGEMDPSTDSFLLEEYADILQQADCELPPMDFDDIYESVRLQILKPYVGHARDPRLESFVRKHQIQALIDAGKTSDPTLPCHIVPLDRNKSFYGRDDLLTWLAQKLCPPEDGPEQPHPVDPSSKTIILRGAGGIGKTQVALEFAHRNKKKFDAVFWCHADDTGKLSTDFDKIAIQLGLVPDASGDSRDQSLTRELVRGWLENPRKSYDESAPNGHEFASWLLILDDVSKPDALLEFMPAVASHGSILVTLPEHMQWAPTANAETIVVDPFKPDEAAAFLSKLTKRGEDAHEQEYGSRIGRRVGGSPHELTFVARIIKEKNYSFEAFIQAQTERESQQAVLSLNLHDLKVEKDNFMFSSWALDVLELGKELLDVLSMFDSDGVPERLLTAWSDGAMIAGYPRNIDDYKDARNELLDYSLISQDKSTGSLLVHRRVQDAARRRMTPETYLSVFYTCVTLLNKCYPRTPFTWRHSVVNWPQIQQLFPHIIRLREHARPIEIVTANRVGDYQYARLCAEVAWYCHERGMSLISEDFCNIGQRFCLAMEEAYDQDPTLETEGSPSRDDINKILADVYHTKGIAATEMNKPTQALIYLKRFNEMMVNWWGSTTGGTSMRLPISWNQLGVAHMMNDDWASGEECFKKSIKTMKQLDNYQPYKISLPLANLACAFWLTGRYPEAVKALEDGMAYRALEFGPDDRESFITGRFYHGLGNVKASQGLWDESFHFHEKARDHYRWTIGRQHHRTADANIRLADHFIRRDTENDLNHAKELLDQALKAYGEKDIYYPEKARALYKRSKLYLRLGKDHDAHCDANESLRLYRTQRSRDPRPFEELKEEDFDGIIVFWSR